MRNEKSLNIKQWAIDDRPREKILLKGPAALSNAELLAILIGSGTREESAVDLAKKILNATQNNLNALGKKSAKDLQTVKGVGQAKASTILAALELGRRRKQEDALEKKKVITSKDAYEYFHPLMGDLPHEEFYALFLNRSNMIIEHYKLSSGGTTGTVIDIKMLLRRGIETLASSVILCHNHPSGNTTPSQADKDITNKIKHAGTYCDVTTLDHIIVCDKNYYSFADEGLM